MRENNGVGELKYIVSTYVNVTMIPPYNYANKQKIFFKKECVGDGGRQCYVY
jgi:hypothetical protein